MPEEANLGEGVATEDAPTSDSSPQSDAGGAEQIQADTSGQLVEQATEAAQAADAQAQSDFEDEDAGTEARPDKQGPENRLWESRNRWRDEATGYKATLAPFGTLEDFRREYVEPLQVLNNPGADVVDKFGAIQQLDPTFSQPDFVSVALDAMPDEMAAPILKERAEDAVKILFGDIFPGITYEDARYYLEIHKPDEQDAPEAFKQRLEAAEQKAAQADEKTTAFEREQTRLRDAEQTRQLEAAQLSLGRRMWETPTEHVIGKLKFGALPPDAPESVKADFTRAQDFVRTQAQLATLNDPHAQNLLRLTEGQLQAAMKAPPEQRPQLMARAERTAAAIAEVQKAKAQAVGEWVKGLLDDRLALRASEASRATDQRAEVVGAGGGGVTSSASRGPMPPYGTPEWERWATAGFTPQPAPRQV